MRHALTLIRAIALWVAALVVTAHVETINAGAATVELDRDGNIALSGEIVKGDAAKLRTLIERHGVRISAGVNRILVLSSPGGNIYETDEIISVFWQGRRGGDKDSGPLATVVPAGAQCLSSCALIFMHGQDTDSIEGTHLPSRWLHADAVLGFHAPFFDPVGKETYTTQELNQGLMHGFRILERIMSRDAIDKSLKNIFIEYGRDSSFKIETARQATRWNIGVFLKRPGVHPKLPFNQQMAYTACYRFQYAPDDDDKEPNATAVSYDSYTGSGFAERVAKRPTYRDAVKRLWRNVYEVRVEAPEGSYLCYAWRDPNDEVGSVYVETDASDAEPLDWTYLLPPSLRLKDIGAFVANPASFPADEAATIEKPDAVSKVTPEPQPAPTPSPITPPLQEVRRGVICNARSGYADIRLHPAAGELPIDKLANNTTVTLNGAPQSADGRSWFLIRFSTGAAGEKLGYVSVEDVAAACSIAARPTEPDLEEEPRSEEPETPAPAPSIQRAVVCNDRAEFARVRRGPTPQDTQIAALRNGSPVTVLRETSNPNSGQPWYEIEFAHSLGTKTIGFIDSDYVKDRCGGMVAEEEAPAEPAAPVAQGSYVICNRGSTYSNVRAGPTGKHEAVGSVNNHDYVTVVGSASNPQSGHLWYRVSFEDSGATKEGYVDSDFVTAACDLPRNAASSRIVCNAKSNYSNVRDGPGKTYSVIAKVYNGDRIWVTKGFRSQDSNHLWFGIAFGDGNANEGYIDADVALVDCPASVIAGAR